MNASDDDLVWLDALAGREPRSAAASGHRPANTAAAEDDAAMAMLEGRLLREALTAQAQLARPPSDEQMALADRLPRVDAALAQARWQPRCGACRRWRARLVRLLEHGAGRLVAAGALATLAWLMVPWTALGPTSSPSPTAPEAPVLRASEPMTVLRAAEPAVLRDRIAAELVAAGLPVSRYERLGRYGIDADWPARPHAALRQVLERHAVPIPDGVELRLEVAPP